MKSNPFSFIRSKVEEHIPEALRPLNNEIKNTTRKIVNEKLAEFDLVPRQEFEQQQRLLAQAEQRIAALEKRLSDIQSDTATGGVKPTVSGANTSGNAKASVKHDINENGPESL